MSNLRSELDEAKKHAIDHSAEMKNKNAQIKILKELSALKLTNSILEPIGVLVGIHTTWFVVRYLSEYQSIFIGSYSLVIISSVLRNLWSYL